MKKIISIAIFAIVFTAFNACQKEVSDVESSASKDLTLKNISAEVLADSLKSVTIGINEVDDIATNMNRLKSGSIYTDWSGKISFQVFNTTSTLNQHNDGLISYVDPDYLCVGGGGYTMYSDEHGAFFTESRPLADLSGWVVSSKDHCNADPHVLVSQAIGVKIEGVPRDVLKQYLQIKTTTSSTAIEPSSSTYSSPGYTIIGGGAKIAYNGAGILLVISDSGWSYGYNWFASGKAHRVNDTGTVTTYLIEASNDSIPGFGKIEVGSNSRLGNYVPYGESSSQIDNTPNLWGITCVGGNCHGQGAGRLVKKLQIISPCSVLVSSVDNYYRVEGTAQAFSVYIRKKQ